MQIKWNEWNEWRETEKIFQSLCSFEKKRRKNKENCVILWSNGPKLCYENNRKFNWLFHKYNWCFELIFSVSLFAVYDRFTRYGGKQQRFLLRLFVCLCEEEQVFHAIISFQFEYELVVMWWVIISKIANANSFAFKVSIHAIINKREFCLFRDYCLHFQFGFSALYILCELQNDFAIRIRGKLKFILDYWPSLEMIYS